MIGSDARLRWLARQFARPQGLLGRIVVAPWLDRIAGATNALVLRELAIGPREDFLEVGFGGGALLAAARTRTQSRVAGADVSPEMVARARRRLGSGAEIVQASVEALPFESGAFDKAASVANLYFWPDPRGGMAELARVVRPGGLLAVAFEPPEELAKWPGHRFGFRAWREEEVRALMESAGFGGIRCAWGTGRKPDRFLCLTGTRRGGDALEHGR
ncbi:MAG TPA: class I SAM-dependent methyltransferase [Allosphingosinicella sp.]|nr:class I SAM-dependent methyltransferase [Allosphingosinicella sp.]